MKTEAASASKECNIFSTSKKKKMASKHSVTEEVANSVASKCLYTLSHE
jgi:hypothetical protein